MLEEIVKAIEEVEGRLASLSKPLDLEARREEIQALEDAASEAGFWDDPAGAQAQMQRLNTLKESLAPWQAARKRLDDARTLAELAGMEDDPDAYAPELRSELSALSLSLDKLEVENIAFGSARCRARYFGNQCRGGRGGRQRLDFHASTDVPALGRPSLLQGRDHGRSGRRCGRAEKHVPCGLKAKTLTDFCRANMAFTGWFACRLSTRPAKRHLPG